jgi:multicomponent Na+:H+ antiporter subunit B
LKTFATLLALVLGALLFYASLDFPAWGTPDTPANSSTLSDYYITSIYDDTLVPNMVTAVLADYRGYDTMFETVVVFTAGAAIFLILAAGTREEQIEGILPPLRISSLPPVDPIVRISTRFLVPVIQIFALYVLAHGHHSPGGGFQGGVILAASFIMMELTSELKSEGERISNMAAVYLGIIGIVIYGGWGIASMFFGGAFLDYEFVAPLIPDSPDMARSHSMLIVEVGVAFTVTSMMLLIFRQLTSGGYELSKS